MTDGVAGSSVLKSSPNCGLEVADVRAGEEDIESETCRLGTNGLLETYSAFSGLRSPQLLTTGNTTSGKTKTFLELLACKGQTLLIWRNAFLIPNLCLDVVDGSTS